MRIRRKKSNNTILWLITSMTVLFLLAGGMYYVSKKVNPTASAENSITISKEIELRTGPDDSYPSLRKVSAGDVVTMLSKSDTWYEIETKDSYVGWIPGWSVLGSGVKSPEDQNKEKLSTYSIVLNPIIKQNEIPDDRGNYPKNYNLKIAKELQKKLSEDGIKVILTRENDDTIPTRDEIKKIVTDNNAEALIDLDVINTETKNNFGVKVYYGTAESASIARSIEKNLSGHYISKVSSSEKLNNFDQLSEKLPQVKIISANLRDKVDVDILNDGIANKQYVETLKEGIESYLYYLINIDNYNSKRKEQLLNLPQKGLNIPMYYTKQDAYKNISYGLDGKKTIEDNGDAIVSLAMISSYLGVENSNVDDIASWAGNKYYIRHQGTQPTIVSAFADKYSLKVERVQANSTEEIEKALKENKPVLVRFKSGLFGNKVTYKVIRGYEDEKFYINDPNDDDIKLTSYNGFTQNDVKNNLAQAWVFSK
ncbi:N-acetylmuramoyl-L-alanine amidase [Gemella cuniculi]|uniref:N-acetylmuramoyl-L-alanine amidase n=1 Tax=Gemella cuniculi TaxID=150240 RepID=UPI00041F868C|nr:N-acetylmuramoyl-L-alanine amidase [Gemella cuniculi]